MSTVMLQRMFIQIEVTVVLQGGQWILALVDYFGGGFIAYVLVLLEVVTVAYIYG